MDFSQILALFGGGSGGGGFDFTKLLGGGKAGGTPMQGGQGQGAGGVPLPFGFKLQGNPRGQQIPQAQPQEQSPLQGVNWGNVDMSALMQMAQNRRKVGL